MALGGLIVAWWLASHLFMATAHALDYAYGVAARPADGDPAVHRARLRAGLGGRGVADRASSWSPGRWATRRAASLRSSGVGDMYALVWSVLRWPLLLAAVVAFLVCLYRFSPNMKHRFRDCLPGAVVGALLWILRRGALPAHGPACAT